MNDDPETIARAVEAVTSCNFTRPMTMERAQGGYAWHTVFLTDAAGESVVVRIAPPGGTMEPYDPISEVEAIARASEAVPTPTVLGYDECGTHLGAPFSVQSRMPGKVIALGDVADDAKDEFRNTFAETLGSLHRHGRAATETITDSYREALALMTDEYRRVALHRHPGFECGLAWIEEHLPESDEPVVTCHGDFRFANLTWTGPGVLGAVLDWERSWDGDPMADIAFSRQFSGWCAIDGSAIGVYEDASGIRVDEDRTSYGLRFERVRAYLSPLRLMRAIHERRVNDPRLIDIAEAGEAGMWELVSWSRNGLVPQPLPGGPETAGPDWSKNVHDPLRRAHFATHPRPQNADADDPDQIQRTAAEWTKRPVRMGRRQWQ